MRRVPRRDLWIALSLYLLNLFDMVATIFAVKSGYGMEINPLMRFLMNYNIWAFVFVKTVVMGVVVAATLQVPMSRRTSNVLVFMTGMYTMLGIGHILIFWNFHGQ